MNLKKYLFIFYLLITYDLFGVFKVESHDKTKNACFDYEKKELIIKLNNSEKPIETLNFNYDNILLKQMLWTQNNQYLIVNIEITTKKNSSKYSILERFEIKENVSHAKPLTPFRKENLKSKIILEKTDERKIKDQSYPYEEKIHQLIKIEITINDLKEKLTKWIDVETGKFVVVEN